MPVISFRDAFTVDITGSNSLAEELSGYYQDLILEENTGQIDLRCEIEDFDCEPSHVLGKPTQYYGREDNWFLKVDKHKKLRIRKDWSEMHFSPEVPKHWVFKLVEYCARRELADEGISLIHASGVRVNGTTLTFPAWRHTGKTNSLMTLLREYDADYLSDDRLWLGREGKAYGFPLPLNLQPYNYNAFPNVKPPTRFYDRRYRTSNFIRDKTSDTGSFFSQALYFFNEFYIAPPSKKVKIEELFPDVGYVDETPLDAVICLQTVEGGEVELREVSAREGARYLRSISQREWNGFIHDFISAFDLLFQEGSAEEEFNSLIQREWEVWTDLLEDVDTYTVTVPREEKWEKKRLSQEILNEISSIIN